MAEGQLTMFGKTYNTVGSADSNLVLLTRGDVKIRWGNKFIDLIKNGKINVDTDVLKTIGSKDSIYKDGIYLVDNEGTLEIWAQIDGNVVNLAGEVGTTYVSYVKELDIDRTGKLVALSNIGIYYNTYDEAVANKVQSGMVYILDQGAIYHYKDGLLVKYALDVDIPNPLTVGSITIDGTANTILGGEELTIGQGGVGYISLRNGDVKILKSLISNDIKSPDYTHKASGYAIYRGDNNLTCLEIDNILIRNKLEYLNIVDIQYEDLVKLVLDNKLIKGKRYRIIDFKNEWEVTEEYTDNTNPQVPVKYYYSWPVTITANSANTFEEYGYFCDNEDWVIKYDISFGYFVEAFEQDGALVKKYAKGRITYMRDEFGNEANYDFKHRLFKHTSSSNDPRTWFFTYSTNNPDYLTNEENPLEYSNVHQKKDFSLTGKITNNTLYIKEPTHGIETVQINGEEFEEDKVIFYDDEYIIFPECTDELYPYNNKILSSTGKYVMTNKFYDNYIEGLIQNVNITSQYDFNFDFFGNTSGIIYIKHEYVAPTIEIDPETEEEIEVIYLPDTSGKLVKFKLNKEYSGNTFLDITNCTFDNDLIDNQCQNVTEVKTTGVLVGNIFEKDLEKVQFLCNRIENNIFKDEIDTNDEPENYIIKGILIKDNVFYKITRVKFLEDCNLTGNTFKDITFVNSVITEFNGIISNSTFENIIGVKFTNSSNISKSSFLEIATNTDFITTQFKGIIKECKFGKITSVLFDSLSDLYKVVTYNDIAGVYVDVSKSEFKDKMENVTFSENITFTLFKGYINRSYFYGTITGTNEVQCVLYRISLSEFNGNISKFIMVEGNSIVSSTLNGINNVEFIGSTTSILKSTFAGNLSNLQYQGTINKSEFNSIEGKNASELGILKSDINMCTFNGDIIEPNISHVGSSIEYCTFLRNVKGVKSEEVINFINNNAYLLIDDLTIKGTISYCNFNGSINGVIIDGYGDDGTAVITNCSFKNLSKKNSDKLKVIGALQNTDIHDNIDPTSAQWVEKTNTEGETDEYIRISDLPGAYTLFEISVGAVPKLAGSGKKDCYLRTVTLNGTTKKIFIVSLGASINADNAIQGMIVMMSGGYPIPDGWAICDGLNGTPDLRGRFIRMISEGESSGPVNNSDLETNGNGTRQAYLKKVPAHTHAFKTYNGTTTASATGLTASYNSIINNIVNVDISGLSLSGSSFSYTKLASTGTASGYKSAAEGDNILLLTTSSPSHTHSIQGSALVILPSINISGDILVSISMTPELDTLNENFPTAVNVEPLAYALIFIMKL